MEQLLVATVRQRARLRCEYCRLPEAESAIPFTIDHIIARQHGGPDALDNLALACPFYNLHKGPNISGVDLVTRQICRLFNPRRDQWASHFRWDGVRIEGTTPIGRATVVVLATNDEAQLAARSILLRTGCLLRADL